MLRVYVVLYHRARHGVVPEQSEINGDIMHDTEVVPVAVVTGLVDQIAVNRRLNGVPSYSTTTTSTITIIITSSSTPSPSSTIVIMVGTVSLFGPSPSPHQLVPKVSPT